MAGVMKFEYQFDENSAKVTVELSPESDLTTVLEQFEAFLKASGYAFDGLLDFVAEEDENKFTGEENNG
jgi:hypothetical protein